MDLRENVNSILIYLFKVRIFSVWLFFLVFATHFSLLLQSPSAVASLAHDSLLQWFHQLGIALISEGGISISPSGWWGNWQGYWAISRQGHAASKRQNWEWSPDWFNAKAQTFFRNPYYHQVFIFFSLSASGNLPEKSAMLSKDLLVLLSLWWDTEAPPESFLHLEFLGHSINLWKHCWLRAWALMCVWWGGWISSTYTVRLYWKG